jgi:hypothetical protein
MDNEILEYINCFSRQPTSSKYIMEKLRGKTNLIVYRELKKVNHIDKIFINNCCIILIELKSGSGHWVCVINHPSRGSIEAFNSYGRYPDDDLVYVPENMKKLLGEDIPLLTKLLYESKRPIEYNDHKLQSLNQEIATCGYYCILRILFKDMDVDTFAKKLMNKKYTPDQMVIMYVLIN